MKHLEAEKAIEILEELRGNGVRITIDQMSGQEREMVGVLGKSRKNVFIVNIGDDDDVSFRQINPSRIKRIICGDTTYTSEGNIVAPPKIGTIVWAGKPKKKSTFSKIKELIFRA